MNPDDIVLATIREIAALAGVSESSARAALRNGRINPVARTLRGRPLFRPGSAEVFKQSRRFCAATNTSLPRSMLEKSANE
jgi:hypothetical protein